MSRKIFNLSLGIIAVFCGLVVTPIAFADTITPDTLTATLRPGQCVNELKTVTLTGSPANVDIMFSFDLTGSMSGIINTAKAQAIEIINAVRLALPDSSVRFGVVSYMDYHGILFILRV